MRNVATGTRTRSTGTLKVELTPVGVEESRIDRTAEGRKFRSVVFVGFLGDG